MIGGIIKYFRFKLDEVLWEIGYTNLLMLLATIPVYESEEDKEEEVKQIDFGDDVVNLGNFLNNLK